MADLLKPGEYEEEMADANGHKAVTLTAVDITGDLADAEQTLLVYYGINDANQAVVQLVEDRIGSKRRSLILPRESYAGTPPITIQRFLMASRGLKVDEVAQLVREHDK